MIRLRVREIAEQKSISMTRLCTFRDADKTSGHKKCTGIPCGYQGGGGGSTAKNHNATPNFPMVLNFW